VGDMRLKAPVLFLVFNRPDAPQRVFDAISQTHPDRLFFAGDGHSVVKPVALKNFDTYNGTRHGNCRRWSFSSGGMTKTCFRCEDKL
jgi:hypothetical protein